PVRRTCRVRRRALGGRVTVRPGAARDAGALGARRGGAYAAGRGAGGPVGGPTATGRLDGGGAPLLRWAPRDVVGGRRHARSRGAGPAHPPHRGDDRSG